MNSDRRHSMKREAIRRVLTESREHPTAEMIYHRLKDEYPDLSLGTVYRNLALFREEGEAICVGNIAGQDRFDADTAPHAHFICVKCGRVLDVEAETPQLSSLPALPGEVRACVLTFYGVCDHCK